MTKLDLQKELLEKVKPGMKPSDLKKLKKPSQTSKLSSPISIEKDDGYSSGEDATNRHESPILNTPKSQAKPNPEIKTLQAEISSLKKRLTTYQDFKDADLKIKEKYKQEIKDLQEENAKLNKTIADLQKQGKTTAEPQPQEIKTFRCSDCNQEKPQTELSRAFNNFSFCLTCSKKARQQAQQEKSNPEPQIFTCHACQQTKQEIPNKMKLDQTLQEYSVCSTCRPTLKEFNEADLITDELWAKYPYSSASEILEKEFGLKKEKHGKRTTHRPQSLLSLPLPRRI